MSHTVIEILSSDDDESAEEVPKFHVAVATKKQKKEVIILPSSDDDDDEEDLAGDTTGPRLRHNRRLDGGNTSPTDVMSVDEKDDNNNGNIDNDDDDEDNAKMGVATRTSRRTKPKHNRNNNNNDDDSSSDEEESPQKRKRKPSALLLSDEELARKLQQEESNYQSNINNNDDNDDGSMIISGMAAMARSAREAQEQKDAAYAASLQSREERARDRRRQRELDSLKSSKVGKAVLLIEQVIAQTRPFHDAYPEIECVGKDDAVFLAEKMLERQDIFQNDGRPTHVCLGYHYTNSANLANIRTDGLLTIEDRQATNNKNTRNIAAFGNGIYTATNPQAFTHFGDVGLLVAVLKGKETYLGNTRSTPSHQDCNTVVGNKTGTTGPYSNEIILRASSQVLPLVKFEQSKILLAAARNTTTSSSSSSSSSYLDTIWSLHEQIQHQVLDVYFNDSKPTTVTRVQHNSGHGGYGHRSTGANLRTTLANLQRMAPPGLSPTTFFSPPDPNIFGLGVASGMVPFISASSWQGSKPGYIFRATTLGTGYYLDSKQMQIAGIATTVSASRRPARRSKRQKAVPPTISIPARTRLAIGAAATIATGSMASPPNVLRRHGRVPTIAAKAAATGTVALPAAASALSGFISSALSVPGAPASASASASIVARRRSSQGAASSVAETIVYNAPENLIGSSNNVSLTTITATHGDCSICICRLVGSSPVVRLPRCYHEYHQECIQNSLKHDVKCPDCRTPITASVQGKSPSGSMVVSVSPSQQVSGYAGAGCIVIQYQLSGGTQKSYHQNPGARYSGTTRVAYLPNIAQGQDLLKRLKYAFRHGLCFTIGTSLTTHQPNCIVWSSVHHKTNPTGGTHGFPDPQYFTNANAELDGLGVPAAASI